LEAAVQKIQFGVFNVLFHLTACRLHYAKAALGERVLLKKNCFFFGPTSEADCNSAGPESA
jgi:hypothetical protein